MFYQPIYQILTSKNFSDEDKVLEVFSWTEQNIDKIKRSEFKNSFKKANREDLLSIFVNDVEVAMGDVVRSYFTNRIGKVVGLKTDGETIVVKWDSGPIQSVAKTSVLKLIGENGKSCDKPMENISDYANLKTKEEPYAAQKDKYVDTSRDVEIKSRENL